MTYEQFAKQFETVWQQGNMTQIRQWQTQHPKYYAQWVKQVSA